MLRSKFLNKTKSSNSAKGFVFTLEVLVALAIFVSFLVIATNLPSNISSISKFSEKEYLSSTLAGLDESGSFQEIMDNSALSADEKMIALETELSTLLPAGTDFKVSLKGYTSDPTTCKLSPTFSDCFIESASFPDKGSTLPSDKEITHEKSIFVNKGAPKTCEVGAVFEGILGPTKVSKLSFSSTKLPKLNFAETEDLNIYFTVNTDPTGTATCGEDIRVDLNVSVPDINGLLARSPVDVIVVMNRSSRMESISVNRGNYAASTLSAQSGDCTTPTWNAKIATLSIDGNITDSDYYAKNNNTPTFDINVGYSDYAGACTPKVRAKLSTSATLLPSASGATGVSPLRINVSGNSISGSYDVNAWTDDLIDYDVNVYVKKIFAEKYAAISFINQITWDKSNDRLGVVSFGNTGDQSVPYNANPSAAKNAISNITTSDTNAKTSLGILKATDMLINQSPLRPNSKKFQIIFSDGYSTGDTNLMGAIQDAIDKNITIYTVGFGKDVNDTELSLIASMSGGEYYKVEDQSTLDALLYYISQQITNQAIDVNAGEIVVDSTLTIPVLNCNYITSTGTYGSCDANVLTYTVGHLDALTDWSDYFIFNIPCDVTEACSQSTLVFPGAGTVFYWTDRNGNPGTPITWDTNSTLTFLYRDLSLEITDAQLVGPNRVILDVNAKNIGLLSSDATTLDFYLDDPNTGTFLKQENVIALNAGQYQLLLDREINTEGLIYAYINRSKNILECPGNNISSAYCTDAPKTKYYVMDVWIWR